MKIILTQDHRTLGAKGTEIDIPEENLKVWIDSGKAKLPKDAKKSAKKKRFKKIIDFIKNIFK